MHAYSTGRYLIAYQKDLLLFYNNKNKKILSYQPSTKQTSVFEHQLPEVPKAAYFVNRNGIPTVFCLEDDENGYRFEKFYELKDGEWQKTCIDNSASEIKVRLATHNPIFAWHDDNTIYVFCDYPWNKSSDDFYIAILKEQRMFAMGTDKCTESRYYYCAGKIDINFVKADAGWDKMEEKFKQKLQIDAGAVVIGDQLIMIYTGCEQQGQSQASMDWAAVFDVNKPDAPPKKLQLKPDPEGKCMWGYAKNFPCYNYFNSPHFHVHGKKIWYTNLGQVACLDTSSWAWQCYDSFSYNQMCGASLVSGSTMTDEGRLFIAWKYSVEKELSVKDYNIND